MKNEVREQANYDLRIYIIACPMDTVLCYMQQS